ncbi:MAG: CPBP family intramembrane glutamic endopeptidase [Solirubrobacteraceae bacterium]
MYLQDLALTVLLVALAVAALAPIHTGALHGSVTVVGKATTPSGYAAVIVLALAEEMLFRGFVAGLLFRRFGFRAGNALQALVFFAPHLLLLLVSLSLWPILPVPLAGGWLLGWLRQRSGSIGPGWIAHSIANILASVILAL